MRRPPSPFLLSLLLLVGGGGVPSAARVHRRPQETRPHTRTLRVNPRDCGPSTPASPVVDCRAMFDRVIAECRAGGPGCRIVLDPGRYPTSCPPGSGAFIKGPGAVNLSSLTSLYFGGDSNLEGERPIIDTDFVQKTPGCPAINLEGSEDVTIANIILDAIRVPHTEGTVVHVADNGTKIELQLPRPISKFSFDLEKYPWVRYSDSYPHGTFADVFPFDEVEVDESRGVATFMYQSSSPSRMRLKEGDYIAATHVGNMPAWGVYGFKVQNLVLKNLSLLSAGGMGLRCDLCTGEFGIYDSEVRAGPNRTISSTADGIHAMHHSGIVRLQNTVINDSVDDGFNVHGNFMVLSDIRGTEATYIDETGPGWIPAILVDMLSDGPVRVAFFNRLTLQRIGPENLLLEATAGFGREATVRFRDPIPAAVKRYDMFLSFDHISAIEMINCSVSPICNRGAVLSGENITIKDSNFNIPNTGKPGLIFFNGGCGAYEDYTEGPFPKNVLIENNKFETIEKYDLSQSKKIRTSDARFRAAVQLTGCKPVGKCIDSGSTMSPSMSPYPLPPCEEGGSTVPTVKPHRGDPGPGRLEEGGDILDGGYQIYENITMKKNLISLAIDYPLTFVDIGAAIGVIIEENTFVYKNGTNLNRTDVCVYSSEGFSCDKITRSNECFEELKSQSSKYERISRNCSCSNHSEGCAQQMSMKIPL